MNADSNKNTNQWYVYYTIEGLHIGNGCFVVVSPLGDEAVRIGPFYEEEANYHVMDIKGYEAVKQCYKWPVDSDSVENKL